MKWLRIKNFEKFQRYKDRDPTWIMLHRTALRDYEIGSLPDAAKAHLMLIWLLASQQKDRRLPFDAKWIAGQIQATSPIDLQTLVDAGFLTVEQEASESEQKAYQNDTGSVHSRAGARSVSSSVSVSGSSSPDLEKGFSEFYIAYPRKQKPTDGRKAWRKLKPDSELQARIMADIGTRYVHTEPKFVPYPASYLNGKIWEGEIETPASACGSPRLTPGHAGLVRKIRELEAQNGNGSGGKDSAESIGDMVSPAERRSDAGGVGGKPPACAVPSRAGGGAGDSG